MFRPTVANTLWRAACAPAWAQFKHALARPAGAQAAILRQLLYANAQTSFGKAHRFDLIRSAADFQAAVPIRDYDALSPWMERVKRGEQNVLTAERVLMMEKTSGSAGPAKYIPYTRTLRRQFQAALRPWIHDLYAGHHSLRDGSAYWSITPLARAPETTRGGLPVGFENDAQYLGAFEQWLMGWLLAVPGWLARIQDLETCLYVTLRLLLQTRRVRFVSVWHPSFLSILVQALKRWQEQLVRDLHSGTITPPSKLTPSLEQRIRQRLLAPRDRARELSQATNEVALSSCLFPGLKVISCWTHAAAKQSLPVLQGLFPGAHIQGKGLLATEGVVSIPFQDGRATLAVTSHFVEFLGAGESRPRLAHELEVSAEYSVIITTGGGLWRYALGDGVRVTGHAGQTPTLEFIGREDGSSDLCGEKLTAAFVANVLEDLARDQNWRGDFTMLAPVEDRPPFYTLFFNGQFTLSSEALDRALRRNPHYDYCRNLGQLAAPRLFRIHHRAYEAYLGRCQTFGQRAGSVKPATLRRESGWERVFQGGFLPPRAAEVAPASL